MASYLTDLKSKRVTPQSEPMPDEAMIKNDAGGYGYESSPWDTMLRFLILGSEGGTYYVSQSKLSARAVACVQTCLDIDAKLAVDMIVDVSHRGRAPKNEPAILALAIASTHPSARGWAYDALPKVCRIPTHLFHFAAYRDKLAGWGMGMRKAIGRWYSGNTVALAYHLVKYQQRDGWSHRDLLRLAHVKPASELHGKLFRYAVGKQVNFQELPSIVGAMHLAHEPGVAIDTLCKLIAEYKLTHEMLPTESLANPKIWDSLLPHMGMTALVRNLGRMSAIDLLTRGSEASKLIVGKLGNQEYLERGRIHPLSVLVAMKIYAQGHGMRGSLNWTPVVSVVDALDDAFYLTFDNAEATGKRILLACDVSGSMTVGQIAGMPLMPAHACAAMAMVTLKAEGNERCEVVGFSAGITSIPLSSRHRLDDALRVMYNMPFSRTDCAQPMLYAMQRNLPFDAFVIITDNETWSGHVHPMQALRLYRERMGIPAKLIVIGTTSTSFTIADPNDPACLDVAGFDTGIPQVMTRFIKAM